MSRAVRLAALGGLGEIGMNCLAVECDGQRVVVDCGVMFPFRELGVDVIHPDFRWLLEGRDRLRAVVLTHGHEDHIGGVPYLVRDHPVPVYGPPYALGLLRERMREVAPEAQAPLHPTEPGTPLEVGPLRIEPFRVTHSIPDATGLLLETPVGTIVHTGDFNIDEWPSEGRVFDADRLRRAGDAGVRLLLSDSTNVGVDGDSGHERDVRDALFRLVQAAPRRVVVSLFSSNVHRVAATLAAARAAGRKVCLLGRSLHTHVRVAIELGLLEDPAALLLPADRMRDVAPHELMVIATGTQGEPPAVLSRLARNQHPDLELAAGDQVILSSRIIPGHEQGVYRMINDFERRGVVVRYRGTDRDVHVSGHACRGEQRQMIELVRPRSFLPVHGTFHHLRRHAALARELGVDDAMVVENGQVVEIDETSMRVCDAIPVGRVSVDAGEAVPETVLQDRALLGEVGIALAVVQVDRRGRVAGEPEVITRGVVDEEAAAELLSHARSYIGAEIAALSSPRLGFDEAEVRDCARRALARYIRRRLGRRPLTYAIVVHVP